jgi:hypothetical protein
MTEKQKAARLSNLETGRKKRAEILKNKKEKAEYDISSEDESTDTNSESDNDGFIISKKPRKVTMEGPKRKDNKIVKNEDNLRGEVDELKNVVEALVHLHKKQNKAVKNAKAKKSGGTKIVVLPQNLPTQTKTSNDSLMEALRKSLM